MNAYVKSSTRARNIAVLLGIGVTCTLLSACGSSADDASAQVADQATPAASVQPSREAGLYRDSQICVVNNSPNIISVAFSKKDGSQGEGVLQPNAGLAGQACGNGWFANGVDLQGAITTIKPDSTMNLMANNPRVGSPMMTGYSGPEEQVCLGWMEASVGNVSTWDNGILKYTATREDDSSDYIRFRVDVTTTENPALDGVARVNCMSTKHRADAAAAA